LNSRSFAARRPIGKRETMQELFWQLKDVDSFTVWTTAIFVGAVFWFIREIVADPLLALFSVPLLMLGGLLSPILFQHQMMVLAYDKEANVAATTAVGVVVTLIVLLLIKWIASLIRDYMVRSTKLHPLERVTPAGPLDRVRRR
jgi:uncharacterized membrane protein